MGGLHAAMTSSLTPFPLASVSWLGPPSAAPVFTQVALFFIFEKSEFPPPKQHFYL